MQIYERYEELLDRVRGTGREVRKLGNAPDGSPVISVRTGGDRLPAVFISAGTHSTEHAGVSAAVELIEGLDTQHQVHIIPTRDPIGLNGFAYALGLGMGSTPEFGSFDDVEAILRRNGEVHFDEDGMVLSLIGDYGYASARPVEGELDRQWLFYRKLLKIEKARPEILEPYKGRRLFMVPGQSGVEGTGDFGRAFTLIISPEGEVLHLNRFHDTVWAPVESRCARRLMAEITPGLSFDLHESQLMEDRFWFSARHQRDPENEEWEQRIAHEVIQAIAGSGTVLASDEDVLGGIPIEQTWFTRSEKGLYWLDANIRGEGLNLADFASRTYGLAFGTEMGMYGSFEKRVSLALITVRTAVGVFEQRYR